MKSLIQIKKATLLFLKENDIKVIGLSLSGSVAKNSQHKDSDFDIIVVSNISRKMHIENFYLKKFNIQLIIIPILSIDDFLLINYIAGSGIIASMLNSYIPFDKRDFLSKTKNTLRENLATLKRIEQETLNRNLYRLRKRIWNLLKDLKNSDDNNENFYTIAELLKSTSQFLLSKRSRFFLPTEKHLYRECNQYYGNEHTNKLLDVYQKSVSSGNYTDFIEYCEKGILDNNILKASSSSDSCIESSNNTNIGVTYLNSYNFDLLEKICLVSKKYSPQIVMNQKGDLLHVGYYFIFNKESYSNFLNDIDKLNLSVGELKLLTHNYQLDIFLIYKFQKYDIDSLLLNTSKYGINNLGNRNIVLNSTLDWVLYIGINYLEKGVFKKYIEKCYFMYHRSMGYEPDKVDLLRIKELNEKIRRNLSNIDLTIFKDRYEDVLKIWRYDNPLENKLNSTIAKAYQTVLPKTLLHSHFNSNKKELSNMFYLFESIFESLMIKYSDRGLIYYITYNLLND